MSGIPVLTARDVEAAVSPGEAVEAVREAFLAHHRGEWVMPPKAYVTNYPAGDFRAMPALGAGYTILKWVSSFPGNPQRGLPTVNGLVVVSDAETAELRAVMEAGAVTALRTGAAAVLAAETLGKRDAATAAVVGVGVNGRAAVRAFVARGHEVLVWDADESRAAAAAEELGAIVAPSRAEALAADLVVTVTPGHALLFEEGSLRPGQHVSLMGADGPGKAEISPAELRRTRLFCDDWEQASHGGELAHLAEPGLIARSDVTELGSVLAGEVTGRVSVDDITTFDSTGLAIQDLAIVVAAMRRVPELSGLQSFSL